MWDFEKMNKLFSALIVTFLAFTCAVSMATNLSYNVQEDLFDSVWRKIEARFFHQYSLTVLEYKGNLGHFKPQALKYPIAIHRHAEGAVQSLCSEFDPDVFVIFGVDFEKTLQSISKIVSWSDTNTNSTNSTDTCISNLVIFVMWEHKINNTKVIISDAAIRESLAKVKAGVTANSIFRQDARIYFITTSIETNSTVFDAWELYYIRDYLVFNHVELLSGVLLLPAHRSKFHGVKLRMLLTDDPQTSSRKSSKEWTDLGVRRLHELATVMNFTYSTKTYPYFILQNEDGTPGGLANHLASHEGDIIATMSEIVYYRVKYFAASQPILHTPCGFFHQREVRSAFYNVFAGVYAGQSWVALISLWIILPTIVVLLYNVQLDPIHEQEEPRTVFQIVSDSALNSVGLMCNQGWMNRPSSTTYLKVILFSGLFASMIVGTVFSSSIIALFADQRDIFTRAQDLVRYGFTIITQPRARTAIQSLETYLERHTGHEVTIEEISDTDKVIKLLETSRTAVFTVPPYFFASAFESTNYTAEHLCSFKSAVKLEGASSRAAIYFRRDDPIRPFFNWKLAMWKERGLTSRQQLTYVQAVTPNCFEFRKHRTIRIIDVRWALYIFGFGTFVALIGFVIERRFHFHFEYGRYYHWME